MNDGALVSLQRHGGRLFTDSMRNQGVVLAATDEISTVRREAKPPGKAAMSRVASNRLGARHVPQARRMITTAGQGVATIGRKGNRINGGRMPD